MDLCVNTNIEGFAPPRATAPRGRSTMDPSVSVRARKCGFCMSKWCRNALYMNVPGKVNPGTRTVAQQCFGFRTSPPSARFEARAMMAEYGLNGWDISYGIIPWLQMCKQHGLIDEIDGMDIPVPEKELAYNRDAVPVSAQFLEMLLRKITFREGEFGEALADGTCYAADRLFGGAGKPLLDHIYPRHGGQTAHWVSHWGTGGSVYFPFWLVPVLQWCVDTRDPASDSTHSYTTHALRYAPEHGPDHGPLSRETVRAVSAKIYGNPDVFDPSFTYDAPETKALPAIFHHDRGMLVESLVLCEYEQPRIFSSLKDDHAADTEILSKLFSLATGYETSEEELDRSGERIFNLLRAIDVRNYGRDRDIDFYTAETLTHPAYTDGVVLDLDRFAPMLDKYYELRGWNPGNGWPTRGKLEELGLQEVADQLETLGKLGEPVVKEKLSSIR